MCGSKSRNTSSLAGGVVTAVVTVSFPCGCTFDVLMVALESSYTGTGPFWFSLSLEVLLPPPPPPTPATMSSSYAAYTPAAE